MLIFKLKTRSFAGFVFVLGFLLISLSAFAQPPCATNPIAGDYCSTATPICNLNGYCGNTSAFYTNAVSPTNSANETYTPLGNVFCATIQNNSWLKFIADSTTAVLSVWCMNCLHNNGVQMQIYATSNCYNFTSVSNCWNPGQPSNGQIVANNLVPGNTYYFMIDGTAGDVCDYVIACDVGVSVSPVVSQNQTICSGSSASVSAAGGIGYTWASNPADPTLSGQTSNAVLNVTPTVTTTYTVTVSNTGFNTFCTTDTTILSTTITVNNTTPQFTSITSSYCGKNNGSASVIGVGGIGTYTYQWNTVPVQTTNAVSSLAPGSYTVTVSSNGCSKTASVYISEIAGPVPSIASFDDCYCNQNNGGAVVQVSGGSPQFTYQWNTIPAQTTSTLQNVCGGTYIVTVTDSANCTATQSITLANVPAPVVSLPALTSVCVNANPISLTGGTPAGGTYSGTAVSGTNFVPSVAGVGIHTITYTYTDIHNCSNSASQTIEVLSVPTLAFPVLPTLCANSTPINLSSATPPGGTYSGLGVSSGTFDPSVSGPGSFIITYSYTAANGCNKTITQNVAVFPLPTVSFATLAGTCVNGTPVPLSGGNPAGGTYSGPGVTANAFNPVVTGLGTFTITYSYTNVNGCTNSTTQTMEVFPQPLVDIGPLPAVCVNAAPTLLSGGNPAGGTYSGTGITANLFTASVSGIGTFQVIYNFLDAFGCGGADTGTILVNPIPVASLPVQGELCANSTPLTLTGGSPLGGYYVGPGVVNGEFDPYLTGPGTFSVGYVWSDTIGCADTAYQPVLVRPLPVLGLSPFLAVCASEDTLVLSGGTPAGGSYSGTSVLNGVFDPISAGAGVFPITYTFTDQFSCTNDTIQDFTVNPLPIAYALSGGGLACEGTGGLPIGLEGSETDVEYTLVINGQVTGFPFTGTGSEFTFGNQQSEGEYSIRAVNVITGCTNLMTDTVELKLLPKPDVNLGDSMYLCDLAEIILDAGSYQDTVIYEWQDGSDTRNFKATEPGQYWVKVFLGNCYGMDTIDIADCSELEIPNVFTPNGDLKNDRFLPRKTGEIKEFKIEIFNRWGKLVYESFDLYEGWDGTNSNNGSECSEGVYFYVASYTAIVYPQSDRQNKRSGSVTLFR
jgi:gliding motility-associated-like protein